MPCTASSPRRTLHASYLIVAVVGSRREPAAPSIWCLKRRHRVQRSGFPARPAAWKVSCQCKRTYYHHGLALIADRPRPRAITAYYQQSPLATSPAHWAPVLSSRVNLFCLIAAGQSARRRERQSFAHRFCQFFLCRTTTNRQPPARRRFEATCVLRRSRRAGIHSTRAQRSPMLFMGEEMGVSKVPFSNSSDFRAIWRGRPARPAGNGWAYRNMYRSNDVPDPLENSPFKSSGGWIGIASRPAGRQRLALVQELLAVRTARNLSPTCECWLANTAADNGLLTDELASRRTTPELGYEG